MPLPLIARYLDRYGVRCDKIRVTSRDVNGVRTRWIGLTLGAVGNLAALRARSPRIPLRDTAEVAKETWRGLRDASGCVVAYRIPVEKGFDEVWAVPSPETWTALEITGTAADLRVAAACAIRTQDKPVSIAGATPLNGRHRPALDALSPLSAQRIGALTGT